MRERKEGVRGEGTGAERRVRGDRLKGGSERYRKSAGEDRGKRERWGVREKG